MNSNLPRNLLLCACIASALSACNRDKAADQPAAPAAAAATASALSLDETKLPPFSRFAAGDLDAGAAACADFNAHVNGKWLAANTIPADRSSWGAAEILAERALAVQHQLAEQAAADKGATGVKKIVGDFWATGMDEAAINAQGLKPLAQELAAIDALGDQQSIAGYLRASAAKGEFPLFNFGPGPDFKQSAMNIAYASQGGLGLPDKTYYFDADKKDVRDAYVAHVARILELGGATPADAASQSREVMAFETRLAKASLSEEQLSRDVELYYHAITPAEADKLSPNFPWRKFFESQGLAVPAMFSLSMPAFHQEVSRMLADVPAAQWKTFLRYSTLDGAAPYLSEPFVQENFAFHSKTLYGQKEMKPRWKRVLSAINGAADETMGQLYVQVAFPPESKKRMEALVANLGVALKGRLEKLAWMSDATRQKALAKQATFTAKIGYPDKWRDWSGLSTNR
ncbi:MAG: peptidase, partial [Pseudoxanthomonas sp.]